MTSYEVPPVNEDLIIYPNPNNGEFSIKCKEEMTLTITNELGQLIKTIKVNPQVQNNFKLNLGAGVYFLKPKEAEKVLNRKVIIVE